MQSASNGRAVGKSRELMALAAASLACVLVVAAGLASGGVMPLPLLGTGSIANVVLIGGILLLGGALI